jgi:hypothetical protein
LLVIDGTLSAFGLLAGNGTLMVIGFLAWAANARVRVILLNMVILLVWKPEVASTN